MSHCNLNYAIQHLSHILYTIIIYSRCFVEIELNFRISISSYMHMSKILTFVIVHIKSQNIILKQLLNIQIDKMNDPK